MIDARMLTGTEAFREIVRACRAISLQEISSLHYTELVAKRLAGFCSVY